MTDLLWPLAATAAAAVLTYWFCMRPMRHGRGCMPVNQQPAPDPPAEFDTQLAAARAELDQLRAATSRAASADARAAAQARHASTH